MNVKEEEIYRYLGFGKNLPDERTKALVSDSLSELKRVINPRFFSRTYPLLPAAEGTVDFSCFQVQSRDLHKNLRGCSQAILFAATIGAEVDRLIRRYLKLEVSRAVIVQAAGAALIESYCDEENERLKKEQKKAGCSLRPRFSPGYGDFSLSSQKDLIHVLEAEKRVGITLTESCLMIPSKSVTAVIGVFEDLDGWENTVEGNKSCAFCGKADCLYRM